MTSPKISETATVFLIGFVAYGTCELIWRGYTHWTMPLLGGICFWCLYAFEKKFSSLPLYIRAVCAGIFITSVELVFGCVVNILLKMNIWDYSELPLNLYGQVCVRYFFIWVLLSVPALKVCDKVRKRF